METLACFTVFVFVFMLHFVGHVQLFDYKDEIAQGTCTSLLTGASDYVFAVRRTCTSSSEETCNAVCNKISKKCYNALHIYNGVMLRNSDTGKQGLKSYKYNTCNGVGCGPNFCCCADKEHPLPNPKAYKDEIAQATCTAILQTSNYVSAVRRHCSGSEDCEAVCSKLSKTCFNALHLYDAATLKNAETGKEGLRTYRYNSCKHSGCGPNFCCCSGK